MQDAEVAGFFDIGIHRRGDPERRVGGAGAELLLQGRARLGSEAHVAVAHDAAFEHGELRIGGVVVGGGAVLEFVREQDQQALAHVIGKHVHDAEDVPGWSPR